MKKSIKFILAITLVTFLCNLNLFGQSKKDLKKQIKELTEKNGTLAGQVAETKKGEEALRKRLDRMSNIEIDDVITPDEQPKEITVGESGWRIELNGTKYKSDLIGQLGTIWVLDSNNQLQPQGAISLAEYKIESSLINPDKDILYKKFISKGTKFEGAGGAPFATITAGMTDDQYSQFSINIEGTSLIKPKLSDLKSIAIEAHQLFELEKNKGVLICTGMHIVRYHSRIYSKNEGEGKINTPVVNIGGSFYAESTEESSEYLVVRQLTQLHKQAGNTTPSTIREIDVLMSRPNNTANIKEQGKIYAPEEILLYFLRREPTTDEIIEFQSNPTEFLQQNNLLKSTDANKQALLQLLNEKLVKIPDEIKSN